MPVTSNDIQPIQRNPRLHRPPPPPPVLAPLAPAAVTVSVADAGPPCCLPAGPVIRSLAANRGDVSPPPWRCFTLNEISQLPPAGMSAAASVTLLVVLVSDSAGAAAGARPAACVPKLRAGGQRYGDCPTGSAPKPLEFENVSTNVGRCIRRDAGRRVSSAHRRARAGVTLISATHARSGGGPRRRGARGGRATCIESDDGPYSVLPSESVTTRVRVSRAGNHDVHSGARCPRNDVYSCSAAPTRTTQPSRCKPRPLPPASIGCAARGKPPREFFSAAIGLSAALTALNALTMPAPHVLVVQAHSTLDVEPLTHTATPAGLGIWRCARFHAGDELRRA